MGVFVDLDTIPEDSISLSTGLRYLLSPRAEALRKVLEKEAVGAADILLRQAARKGGGRLFAQLPQPPAGPAAHQAPQQSDSFRAANEEVPPHTDFDDVPF